MIDGRDIEGCITCIIVRNCDDEIEKRLLVWSRIVQCVFVHKSLYLKLLVSERKFILKDVKNVDYLSQMPCDRGKR